MQKPIAPINTTKSKATNAIDHKPTNNGTKHLHSPNGTKKYQCIKLVRVTLWYVHVQYTDQKRLQPWRRPPTQKRNQQQFNHGMYVLWHRAKRRRYALNIYCLCDLLVCKQTINPNESSMFYFCCCVGWRANDWVCDRVYTHSDVLDWVVWFNLVAKKPEIYINFWKWSNRIWTIWDKI